MPPSTSRLFSASTADHNDFAGIASTVDLGLCSGKTIFITGAAAGIGKASAILFAAAGANRIAIADHTKATTTRTQVLQAAADAGKLAPDVILLSIDVHDVQSIEAGLMEVRSRWGHVDILINNPGTLLSPEVESQSLAARDIKGWRLAWESHIKGTYMVARALVPLLLQGTDQTVVNVTSIDLSVATMGSHQYRWSKQCIATLSGEFVLECVAEGLLAYSMYGSPEEMHGNSRFANDEGAFSDEQVERAGGLLVSLSSTRREWLSGRQISFSWSMRDLMARKDEIICEDLLKDEMTFRESVRNIKISDQRPRGRVPRSSY